MSYKGIELCEENGKVAVLISYGFGAGWSSWNRESLAYDKNVVELFDKYPPQQNKTGLKQIQNELEALGYKNVYMGGYNDIKKEWIEKGVPFRIDEYDGAESLQTLDDLNLIQFD